MIRNIFLLILILFTELISQFGSKDSGGILSKEQSCYDVKFYNLVISIDPAEKAIAGTITIKAVAAEDFSKLNLNLDNSLVINSIDWNYPRINGEISYSHEEGIIKISVKELIQKGKEFSLTISYSGIPLEAKRAPWDDGFVWKKTKFNNDWITLTCQGGGADIWFPCKDHPSDEPDSVSLHFTYPESLICIGSGKFVSLNNNSNGTVTSNWLVSTPINNYNVMFYLGPYKTLEYNYTSTTGEIIPFTVYVLPESFEKAKIHSAQFVQHMKINEEICGPYPFRADKYSVVETPHLGMEHQTAIAYGFGWKNHKDFPFDWLHHHEFSHEWWGNLVTARDWSDFWIHEGTGTYMQPLYLEKVYGRDMYMGYLKSIKKFSNKQPVAPRGSKTSGESYTLDIYYKGAWVLHTLRNYLGDKIFFEMFRRWAYPTEQLELVSSGEQCRTATTDEFLEIAEKISNIKLDWFWEVYLRSAQLPRLLCTHSSNKLMLKWKTENDQPFYLPVEILVNGSNSLIDMTRGSAEIEMNMDSKFQIDPESKILMDIQNITIEK